MRYGSVFPQECRSHYEHSVAPYMVKLHGLKERVKNIKLEMAWLYTKFTLKKILVTLTIVEVGNICGNYCG